MAKHIGVALPLEAINNERNQTTALSEIPTLRSGISTGVSGISGISEASTSLTLNEEEPPANQESNEEGEVPGGGGEGEGGVALRSTAPSSNRVCMYVCMCVHIRSVCTCYHFISTLTFRLLLVVNFV